MLLERANRSDGPCMLIMCVNSSKLRVNGAVRRVIGCVLGDKQFAARFHIRLATDAGRWSQLAKEQVVTIGFSVAKHDRLTPQLKC